MNRTLRCIGDSHVSIFRGVSGISPAYPDCPDKDCLFKNIQVYHAGSFLAYNLCDTSHTSNIVCTDIINKYVEKDDIILLCFGEIDCRNHIVKQAEIQGISLEQSVIKCVDRYWQFINELKNNNTVIVYGPIPSSNRPYFKYKAEYDRKYPYYGKGKERNIATKIFNDYISELCKKNDVGFVTLFYRIIRSDRLNCKSRCFQDRVHIKHTLIRALQSEFKKDTIAAEVSFERK